MASVQQSVLVPYSVVQMFALVERIEDYPLFLPWCGGATILERAPEATLARIEINFHGVRAHFTTANREQRPERIAIELRDGPFRQLDGTWQFRALTMTASKVELELHYVFAPGIVEQMLGPVFRHIAHSLVDAFVRRAQAVYAR